MTTNSQPTKSQQQPSGGPPPKWECSWCGDDDIDRRDEDGELCEQCYHDTIICTICNDRVHYESKCRHVFQDSGFIWQGSGAGYDPDDSVKDSVILYVSRMPFEFAAELRDAIASGRFHTWFVAPLIGGGGLFYLNGVNKRGREAASWWGQHFCNVKENDPDNDDLDDAYGWLASLYEKKTPKANALTIAWLDEFITARDDERALASLDDDGGCRGLSR